MSDNPVFERIQSEIDENSVVLFMKGTPMMPQCGFSAAITSDNFWSLDSIGRGCSSLVASGLSLARA